MNAAATNGFTTPSADWAVGLCGCCCADAAICCRSTFCPCMQYGMNQEQLRPGAYSDSCAKYCLAVACWIVFLPTGNVCFCCDHVHGKRRREIKARYGIPQAAHCGWCADCLTVSCCPCCAVAQEGLQLQLIPLPPPPVQQMK